MVVQRLEQYSAPQLAEIIQQVLNDYFASYLYALRKCRSRATPKRVHALRVSIRRCLAVFSLIAQLLGTDHFQVLSQALRKDLKRLGTLRNLQLQRNYLKKLRGEHSGIIEVNKLLKGRQRAARRRVEKRLDSRKPRRLSRLFRSNIETFLASMTEDNRRRLDQSLCRTVLSICSQLALSKHKLTIDNPETVHEFRILAKELRYQAEAFPKFFAKFFPITPAELVRLRALQNDLGRAHDLALLRDRLACSANVDQLRSLIGSLLNHEARLIKRAIANYECVRLLASDGQLSVTRSLPGER